MPNNADRLGAGGVMVHVGRLPAQAYRDGVRTLRGAELDEWAALRELHSALQDATPVVRELEPEVWVATLDERGLRVTGRVVRWERHAFVVTVAPRAIETATLDARWTQGALEEYAASRGTRLRTAELELRAAVHDAKPVDVEVQPERWRWRSGIDRLDVAILANRIDARGTRLVISALTRPLNAGGPAKGRRR